MKKVAMVSDGWKRQITYAWTDGIMKKIQESGEEVCLFQYQSFGNWSKDNRYNRAEYNIHCMQDYSDMDGIILDCNNIENAEEKNRIINLLRASGKPVVSIGQVIEGFYYVGIDNREPINSLVNHMYYNHGCRKFVWAGGPRDNYENNRRLDAFKSSLAMFNIQCDDQMILSGDYDYATGQKYVDMFVKENREFPDVFICANDNIAAGICAQVELYGKRVPDDFKVTGFDNLEKAAYFRPQITTVNLDRGAVGQRAMEILLELWEGKELAPFQFVSTDCIYGESCGCANNGRINYREHLKNQIIWKEAEEKYNMLLGKFEGDMTNSETFEDLFATTAEFFKELDCDGLYIGVDRTLFKADENTVFLTEKYDYQNFELAIAVENGQVIKYENQEDFHIHLMENQKGQNYLITPLHFLDQCIGIMVLRNGRFLYDNPYLYDVKKAFASRLEALFKKDLLQNAIARIKEVYDRDQLTGLYNRIAYKEMILPLFKNCNKKGIKCALAFFDVDNFKEINDTKGHSYGDNLLIKIADILRKHQPEDGYAYRFGGDEFVVFFPNADEDKINTFKDKVEKDLGKKNVKASVGIIVTDPDSGKSLDDYLVIADLEMYNLKRQVHAKDNL